MQISFYITKVYGNELCYLAEDTAESQAIKRLTGTKTLNQNHFDALTTLGIEFVEIIPPRK